MQSDEYLELLIQNFYARYAQQNVLLSVYNLKQQIVFFTDQLAKISGFTKSDLYNTIDELAQKYPGTACVHKIFKDSFEVISRQCLTVSTFYHGFRDGYFHVVLYQIEGLIFQNEICGYTCKSTNLTPYFLNPPMKFTTSNKKAILTKEQLNILSKRELQVLFLLMLNLKQTEIALMLNISVGNTSKLINNVCTKLINSSSSRILLNTLDRYQVIRTISNHIEIDLKPIIFSYVDKEFNLEITNHNAKHVPIV